MSRSEKTKKSRLQQLSKSIATKVAAINKKVEEQRKHASRREKSEFTNGGESHG